MATNNMTKDNRKEGSKPNKGGVGGGEGRGRQTRQTNNALCEKLLHFKKLRKIDSNFIAPLCAAAASRGEGEQGAGAACVGGFDCL